MEVQKICDEAAAILEKSGWCQEDYFRGERVCLIGALMRAALAAGVTCKDEGWNEILRSVSRRAGTVQLYRWNDHPDRTKEEVIALLRDKLPVPVKLP